jgi:hypothetical protein
LEEDSTRLSVSTRRAATAATNAMGTLISSVQRHEARSVSVPPRTRPMATPPPATALYTPNARARSRASVKVTVSSDSDAGAINAANAPWSARAPNSIAESWARPPSADAVAKPRSPITSIRRRPR